MGEFGFEPFAFPAFVVSFEVFRTLDLWAVAIFLEGIIIVVVVHALRVQALLFTFRN